MYDYRFLEQNLNAVLSTMGTRLSKEETVDLKSYIEAGEYGVAFQYLCEILIERNQPIPPESFKTFEDLGTKMSMDPRVWAGLRILAAQQSS
jgi:hypothetical protein